MTYRELSAEALAEQDYDAFLDELEKSLTDGRKDPNDVVRDTLLDIYFGASYRDREGLTPAARVAFHNLDPRNITTEPEYYSDIDAKLYAERKPMIWLWQMFDRSALGQNSLLAHRFRRRLAPLIFRKVGANFKCWQYVEWSFGYNLSFGDNVVVHRHVLLDDRGGIEIGNDVSISDYVNIYSHTHDIYDIHKVLYTADANRQRRSHHLSRHRSGRHNDRRQRNDRHRRRRHSRRRAESHRRRHTCQNCEGQRPKRATRNSP